MGRRTRQRCVPPELPEGAVEEISPQLSPQVPPLEVVRVPVQAILYLQAMAENGQGDRPKPLGPALPSGHVRYRQ